MLSEMRTAYDDLSIVESAQTSSSKYAGFTLLVNQSGTSQFPGILGVRANGMYADGGAIHEAGGGCREHP